MKVVVVCIIVFFFVVVNIDIIGLVVLVLYIVVLGKLKPNIRERNSLNPVKGPKRMNGRLWNT